MKRDLRRAYRQLFSSPETIHLLGYTFEGLMYFDVTLSMGSASATYCCQRMTNAITYIYGQFGYEDINYLDDLGAAKMDDKAEEAFDCLGYILDTIGIHESENKACAPMFIAVFLGILFNTLDMTMTIVPDRLKEIRTLLTEWENKKSTDLREIQVLLGKLNFVASTVRAGRVFVSRIINELKGFPKNRRRKVSTEMKKDIHWWLTFMEKFNGVSIVPPLSWDAPDVIFSTDSCLNRCGGWSQTNTFQGEAFTMAFPNWIMNRRDVHINEKELLWFIIALKLWRKRIANRNVLAFCDNQVSVEVVNKGAASNRFSQACLREITFITATHNAMLKLVFRPRVENRISDGLSRYHTKEGRECFAQQTGNMYVRFLEAETHLCKFSSDW